MSIIRLLSCLLTLTLFDPATVLADKMEEPKVDYTATSLMEVEGMKKEMNGKVFHSKGNFRQEMSGMMGMDIVSITRKDKKVIWSLMPASKSYSEVPLEKSENDLSNMEFEKTLIGKETINGMETTKYKALGTAKDGKKFGGFFWVTSDNIAVKAALLFKEGEKKTRMTQELKDLKIGSVDSKLFEIPEGYTKNESGPSGALPKGSKQPDMKEMMKHIQKGGGNIDPEVLKKMMNR